MHQRELVSGFSDLKDTLIRTYKIERPRNQIRLYFTFLNNELWMHDYADHEKKILLLKNELNHLPEDSWGWKLINDSIKSKEPHALLNTLFQLHGFFRF